MSRRVAFRRKRLTQKHFPAVDRGVLYAVPAAKHV
jgi:hypothetical protein